MQINSMKSKSHLATLIKRTGASAAILSRVQYNAGLCSVSTAGKKILTMRIVSCEWLKTISKHVQYAAVLKADPECGIVLSARNYLILC